MNSTIDHRDIKKTIIMSLTFSSATGYILSVNVRKKPLEILLTDTEHIKITTINI